MVRNKVTTKKTSATPPPKVTVEKENLRLKTRNQTQKARDLSRSDKKDSDTDSDPTSSPSSKESSPAAEKSRAKKARATCTDAKDNDDKDIKPDAEMEYLQDYLDMKYLTDSKVNKDARMDVIVKLHTKVYGKQQTIFYLRRERYEYSKKNEVLEKRLGELEQDKEVLESTCSNLSKKLQTKTSEYEELQRNYQRKLTELTGKRKKAHGNEENQELVALLKAQAGGFLFSKCKFVNNQEQEYNLGKLMWHYGQIPAEHKQDRDDFVHTYSPIMRREIFARRSYVQTEFRKLFRKAWSNGSSSFPSVESLVKCVERKVVTPEEYDVFVFYCEELLSKMVGVSEWNKKTFCFSTISDAIRQNTKIALISSSDEAFAVLLVDNCIGRWTEEMQEEDARAKDQAAKNKENDKSDPEPPVKREPKIGKYTSSTTGQAKYGGWNQNGLKYFNRLKKINESARENPRCKVVEEKCVELLRKNHKITAKTWEDQSKRRSRKRRLNVDVDESAVEPEEEVVADVEMISDLDD